MIQFLSFIFLIGVVQCIPDLPISPCEYNDTLCMVESQNRHYHNFIPAYHLDPLNIKTFNVSSPTLELSFIDPVLKGLEGCSVIAVNLDLKTRKLSNKIACPWLVMTGSYRSLGLVLGVQPVDGDGPFFIIFYGDTIMYELDIQIYKGPNEKEYLRIDNTRTEYGPRGDDVLRFKNLVRESNQASKEAQLFLTANAKEIVLLYQKAVVDNFMQVVLTKLNYYFWNVPMVDIFSGPQHKWVK